MRLGSPTRLGRAWALGLLAGAAALAGAAPARAYLVDSNDAAAVPPGEVFVELQPVGYLLSVGAAGEGVAHRLVAPSLGVYAGLAPRWDLQLVVRGYAPLEVAAPEPAFALRDVFVGVKRVLIPGRYSEGEGWSGPSLAIQAALLAPPTGGELADGGAGAGLLFAQQWDALTLHLNAWVYGGPDGAELFGSAVLEGPASWSLRPVVEVWVDYLADAEEPWVSGMLAAVLDLTDTSGLEAGVRGAGWGEAGELEVRLVAWWSWGGDGAEPAARPPPAAARRAPRFTP